MHKPRDRSNLHSDAPIKPAGGRQLANPTHSYTLPRSFLPRQASVRNVWLLTFVVTLFGFANGGFQIATPQACLKMGLPSQALGLIGTGLPLGYALSALLLGQLLARFSGKYVLLAGGSLAGCSMLAMSQCTTTSACVIAQIIYGISCGAFWPFASAWLLDFQADGVARTRILRHYNVAWTSGTATGMFMGGFLCDAGYIFPTIAGCGALCFAVVTLALFVKKTMPEHAAPARLTPLEGASSAMRLGLPILLAACLGNIMTLSLRGVILNNYPELNAALGFDAGRLGMLSAVSLGAQLTAFFIGASYESWLGLRRVYAIMAGLLVLISLGYAFRTEFSVLLILSAVHGFVNALAFQSGLLAATSYFSRPRTGTTVHEATVGLATMSPLPAGWLVAALKSSGVDPLDALRSPLIATAVVAVLGLIVQQIMVSSRHADRKLLHH